MCIFITLPESILRVYQFSCVDACIPIQYKCIDTNELYFYRILYYRDFTSRYISYRIVYFILIGAGYIHIYAYICVFIYVYVYIYIYVCVCVYVPANACYHVYMIICMFSMCAHFMYADFMIFFYLWLLGQRWPNKEVQTYRDYELIQHKVFFKAFIVYLTCKTNCNGSVTYCLEMYMTEFGQIKARPE